MKKGIKLLVLSCVLFVTILTACVKEEHVGLTSPSISKFNDSTVTWSPVQHAVAYDVEVNQVVSRQTAMEYKLDDYGTYVVRVKAIAEANSKYKDSAWSESFTISYEQVLPKLEKPLVLKNSYASIKWSPVDDASGYRVFINGEAVTPDLKSNVTVFNILYLDFGVYSMQVQALPSNPAQYEPSDLSNAIQLELINPLTFGDRLSLSLSGDSQITVEESASYTITVVDSHNIDTSFFIREFTWSIVSGDEFASVDNGGNVTAIAPGEVVLKATSKIYPSVFGQITIEIIAAEE